MSGRLKDFLTTTEAAHQLDVTTRTIRDWIKDGKLKAAQVNPDVERSPFRIPQYEVDRILEERQRQLGEEP